nr:HTTM domain-containing protein [uncultured Lacibacter sp.]
MTNCSPYQFSAFRIYLGFYILIVILNSYSSAADIWSTEGLVAKSNHNLSYGIFPNLLNMYDSPGEVKLFLSSIAFLSLLFIVGFKRRIVAFLLWYGLTCLLNRNNMILNPAIPYIGWLLLACTIIPYGEPLSVTKKKTYTTINNWQISPLLITGAWLIFFLGYFFSGIDKLYSASWIDGTAVKKIMFGPLGLSSNDFILGSAPNLFFTFLNWFVIIAEITCLPLALFKQTRKWSWIITTLLQIGILLTLSISTIVYGMLAIHILLFDKSWFEGKMQ